MRCRIYNLLQFLLRSSGELIVPFIKEYKQPDLMSIICSSTLMVFPNLFEALFLKKAVSVVKESLFRPCPESFLEPRTKRNLEAILRPLQDGVRHMAASRISENSLCSTPLDLERQRQTAGKLHDAVIKERSANFKSMSHAHAVHFRENVFREIGLNVGEQHSADRIQTDPLSSGRQDRVGIDLVISPREMNHLVPGKSARDHCKRIFAYPFEA